MNKKISLLLPPLFFYCTTLLVGYAYILRLLAVCSRQF